MFVESAQKVDLCNDKNVKNRLKQSALYDMFGDVDNVFVATTESEVNKADDDWCVNLSVQGKQLCVEIDTGAKCNILSLSALEALNVPYNLSDKTVLITGVHGESERSIGSVTLACAYNSTQRNIRFNMMNGRKPVNLLGRDDRVDLGLIKRVHVTVADVYKNLVTRYADVFKDSIGCMPGEYEIKVDENISPVVHPSRSVPVALRKMEKDELDQTERDGILAKVTQPTPWVSSMGVVRKKNKDRPNLYWPIRSK